MPGPGKKTPGDTPKRKRGAPYGNKNAVGNHGGAPVGNTNALVHGGYSQISLDTLTDEERALIAASCNDTEQLIAEEIDLLTIRERRMLKRIGELCKLEEKAQDGTELAVSGTVRTEEKREFDSEADKTLFEEIQRERVESGELLPGHRYTLTTTKEAAYNAIIRIEDTLTRCQAMKRRYIQALIELRRNRAEQTEIEDMEAADVIIYGTGQETPHRTTEKPTERS